MKDNGGLVVGPGSAADAVYSCKRSTDPSRGQKFRSESTVTDRTPLIQPQAISDGRKVVTNASLTATHSNFRGGISPTRFWVIFSQVLAVQFLVCFDATIIASSHPVITSYFGAAGSASWLSTSFLLTSTAFQPLLGRLSDGIGRKPVFAWCLVIFGWATSWCALAGSIESLIAARAFCGLGAGGLMTLGNIITSDLVPIERRGLYQPYSNIIYGVGSTSGAALGGAMAEFLGWRWEFGVQVPVLAICLGVSLLAIPHDIGLQERSKGMCKALQEFDLNGSVLLAISTTSIILGLNLGGNVFSWDHPLIITSFAIFAACVPIFIWVQSRVASPIMPLNLISHRPRANLIFSNFIAAMLTNAILFNMPIFFRAVLLSSASSAGLRLMIPSIISSMTSAISGFAITWTRHLGWPVILGGICYSVGIMPLCFLQQNISSIGSFLVLIPSALGQGFQYTGSFIAILATSTQQEQATVISTLLLWRNLGMVFGISTSSLIVRRSLIYYLEIFVQGDKKSEIIKQVSTSVEAVLMLEQPYQRQVIKSYEAALRIMFGCCAVMACIGLLVVLPVRLPRLASRKS